MKRGKKRILREMLFNSVQLTFKQCNVRIYLYVDEKKYADSFCAKFFTNAQFTKDNPIC